MDSINIQIPSFDYEVAILEMLTCVHYVAENRTGVIEDRIGIKWSLTIVFL